METYEIERLVRIWHDGEILKSKANKKGIDPVLYTHVLGVGQESWELCEILKSSQGTERARKGTLTDSDMGDVIASGSTKDLFVYQSNNNFRAVSEGGVLELSGHSDCTTDRENKNVEILLKEFCCLYPAQMAIPVEFFFNFVQRWMDREPREVRIPQRGVMFEGIFQGGTGIPEAQVGAVVRLYVDSEGMRLFYVGNTSKPPVIFDPGYGTLLKVEATGHEAGRESPNLTGFGLGVVGSVKGIVGAKIVNSVFSTDTPPSCSLRVIYQDAMFEMRLSPPLPPKYVLAHLDGIRIYLETEQLKQKRSEKAVRSDKSQMEELERAAALRDRDVISEEEFQVVKSRILGIQ